MALSATLAELETWIRQDADMQAPDDRVTSEECRNRINRSLAQLYDRLVLVDQEYFLKTATIASSGAGSYDILNDGRTGRVVSIVFLTPSGTGYAVGDLIRLTQVSTGANSCLATVTAVVGGAVSAATVSAAGTGYVSDNLSTFTAANINMSPVFSAGSGGQTIIIVESEFYKCKGVWFSSGGSSEPDTGNWCPLRRFNWEQQNALNQSSLYGGVSALPLYRVITKDNRDKVVISPDQLTGAYKLWYYPAPPRLLLPTDRFDGRAGWDEWIVKDVAIQLLMAEESVEQAATLKAVRDEIWQRIQLHAEDREAAQPQRIMDATLLSRRYGPRWAR